MPAAWAGVAAAVAPALIGAVAGGSGSQGPTETGTSTRTIDPRMQALLYGNGANKGLLGDTDELRKKQMAMGGLNDTQRAGLEMQRQTLMDPRYTQGFDQMRNQGSSLMGAPVAGNPYAHGYQGGTNFMPDQQPGGPAPVSNLGMSRPQNTAPAAANTPIPSTPAQPIAAAPMPDADQTDLQKFLAEMRLKQAKAADGFSDYQGAGFLS